MATWVIAGAVSLCLAAAATPLRATEAGGDAVVDPAPRPAVAELAPAALAGALLAETNRIRRAHGRRPLRPSRQLAAAADDQAEYMALVRRAQHTSAIAGRDSVIDRVRRRGLEPLALGENVAGLPLPDEANLHTAEALAEALVAEWMNSPPHRQALLNREFTHFGGSIRFAPLIARVWAAYSVQVFAGTRTGR